MCDFSITGVNGQDIHITGGQSLNSLSKLHTTTWLTGENNSVISRGRVLNRIFEIISIPNPLIHLHKSGSAFGYPSKLRKISLEIVVFLYEESRYSNQCKIL